MSVRTVTDILLAVFSAATKAPTNGLPSVPLTLPVIDAANTEEDADASIAAITSDFSMERIMASSLPKLNPVRLSGVYIKTRRTIRGWTGSKDARLENDEGYGCAARVNKEPV
jgi:hypothetical protein